MLYFGYKFVKFFVELPTFDCKICLFSLNIFPFYYPKTKFKHTLTFFGFCNHQQGIFSIVKCHNIVKVHNKLRRFNVHEWFTDFFN